MFYGDVFLFSASLGAWGLGEDWVMGVYAAFHGVSDCFSEDFFDGFRVFSGVLFQLLVFGFC
jgi:hypothetical protein